MDTTTVTYNDLRARFAEVTVVSRLWITLLYSVSYLACMYSPALGQETQTQPPKKVWTNDDLKRLPSEPVANAKGEASSESPGDQKASEPYRREKDPQWYAGQLEPLRRELDAVEDNLRGLRAASTSGKGGTGVVNLGQEEEGVTTDGQITLLQRRREQLLKRIDELEEQARHHDIPPGVLRAGHEAGGRPPAPGNGADAASGVSGEMSEKNSRAAKELEDALAADRRQLEDANKEVDLLRRDQKLEEQKEFSKPETMSRGATPPKLAEISSDLLEKGTKVQELEQRIAEFEDRLEDVRRRSSSETGKDAASAGDLPNQVGDGNSKSSQNDKEFWRRQFSELDYKIRMAKSEQDILQREHNVLLLQYYSNPATAMKEGVTRRDINEHRKTIEEKEKELAELKKQREDLEDALRHAGGPAGWARSQ
ncbi:MAG TPA: hypothetical protein VFI45_02620 [Candidatus Acidoferrum sp.]|nr:hypothetical protein [Candidatus Acidoferrum sp.]